jgi:hypothetical protein
MPEQTKNDTDATGLDLLLPAMQEVTRVALLSLQQAAAAAAALRSASNRPQRDNTRNGT